MKPKILCLLAGLVACLALAGVFALYQPAAAPVAHNTAPVKAEPAEELVVELPDDGRAFYVSIFVHANWRQRAEERQLVAAWQSDKTLRSLWVQSHSKIYEPDDPMVKTRYAKTLPELPCVRVQDSTGKVLYQASGDEARNYIAQREAVGRLFPWWKPCPGPNPCPKPTPDKPKPDVDVDVNVTPVPDTPIPDTPLDAGVPWGVILLVAAGAGVVAFLVAILAEVKRTIRGK